MVLAIGAIGNHVAVIEQAANNSNWPETWPVGQSNARDDLCPRTVFVRDEITDAGGITMNLSSLSQ
ncbi:hypothetical protein DLM46_29355 [Paraburkholderia lacunae]|uniref:Uncharacterized protein n=1 Tax=Paraburkholderia lacunae TaxID=2211104 RepID=A0A370N154_9BURK|nr:hypothetical protein DLM46_29355 [Paraburkholderia lacunae]